MEVQEHDESTRMVTMPGLATEADVVRWVLGLIGLLVLGGLAVWWRPEGTAGASLDTARFWIAGGVTTVYVLLFGVSFRRWGWLFAPWVAAVVNISAVSLLETQSPEAGIELASLVSTVLFGGWAIVLTVAAALGVWLGRQGIGRTDHVQPAD
ncbi:MAG: hypothetical protein ACKOCK_07860 [Chloroflexota bacterium]